MQLTIITFIVIFLMCVDEVKAQMKKISSVDKENFNAGDSIEIQTEEYYRADWKKVDINFLNSYYVQDGNNGAVTGGIGTEYLTDFTQKVSVSFPTSPKLRWNIDAAYDYYSSASTDNIDNIRSSDSQADIRSQLSIGFDYAKNENHSYGARLATSVEYDYTSFNAGLSYSFLSNSGNSRIDFQSQAFYDIWYLIYPVELRGEAQAPTDKRQSYNGAITFSQVLNRKMQFAVMAEATYMKGLLSTPFHRVYFQEQEVARIENLPDNRLKIPLGLRLNTYLSERLILRTYYRYYWDSWGMHAHTATVELPVKINRFFAIYPHYRYHTQTAVDYFKPYKAHSVADNYYTSDYDLSELHTHTYGIGILYGKAGGLFKIKTPFKKRPHLVIENIDIKYSHYDRSTGLVGDIISLGIKIGF